MTGPVIAGIALAWGFAEATLFFIVADVLLTFVTVWFGLRRGLSAVVWVTVGAVAGGAAMYRWSVGEPAAVQAALISLPAIDQSMLDEVRRALHGNWQSALFRAGFTGVPYKIFAALAPQAGIEMTHFMLVSVPARLARFLSLVLVTSLLSRLVSVRLGRRQQVGLLAVIWVVFYALYWISMPG